MSFLSITIPASLLLAAVLLALVVRAVREGAFDDWEGPAVRHWLDDDAAPERDDQFDRGEPERDDQFDRGEPERDDQFDRGEPERDDQFDRGEPERDDQFDRSEDDRGEEP